MPYGLVVRDGGCNGCADAPVTVGIDAPSGFAPPNKLLPVLADGTAGWLCPKSDGPVDDGAGWL